MGTTGWLRRRAVVAGMMMATLLGAMGTSLGAVTTQDYALPEGAGAHDVWPAPDGTVWFTAQAAEYLGRLEPRSGKVEQVALGRDAAPHGVILGPDGAAWVTDGGQNAIVRVDPATRAVRLFPLPEGRGNANLNTAAFDPAGMLWFTGQNGFYGRVDPGTGALKLWDAPRGVGPYGIAALPDGALYYASLAGSYVGRIDPATGTATVIEPPTPGQGARRIWADRSGRLWVSGWNAGEIYSYDPKSGSWSKWKVPGAKPMPYAIYVDEQDKVWLSDWGSNALWRFDPATHQFERHPLPQRDAQVRQLAGRKGEVWGAESGVGRIVVMRFE